MSRPNYFTNCRGTNYLPVYAKYWDPPFNGVANGINFSGTASQVAIWRFYDSSAINNQISVLKNMGINTIRMFLTYYAWENHEGDFLSSLKDFVDICDRWKMYVQWVFFDHFHVSPTTAGREPGHNTGDPYDDVDWWTRNPGNASETSGWIELSGGKEYIQAIVSSVSSHQCTVMYDVMNEPANTASSFLNYAASCIREFDPIQRHKILASWAFASPYYDLEYDINLNNSSLNFSAYDVIGFHPYNAFKRGFEEWANFAASAGEKTGKPIIVTEGGSPNLFQDFGTFFNYCEASSLGFLYYAAMTGHPSGNMPFKDGTGHVFHDGTTRDIQAASGLSALALRQGRKLKHIKPPTLKTSYTLSGGQPQDFEPYAGYPGTSKERQAFAHSGIGAFSGMLDILRDWENRTYLSSLTAIDDLNDYFIKHRDVVGLASQYLLQPLADVSSFLSGTAGQRNLISEADQFSLIDFRASALDIRIGNCETSSAENPSGTCIWDPDVPVTWVGLTTIGTYDYAGYDEFYTRMGNFLSGVLEDNGWDNW